MKINSLFLSKILALSMAAIPMSYAESINMTWPSEWTNAPTEILNCDSGTTSYISGTYKDAYYTDSNNKTSLAAQYNLGTGSFLFALYFDYTGKDSGVDGDIWLTFSEGSVSNVAVTNLTGQSSSNSHVMITNVQGDANYYYTGSISTGLIMGGSLIRLGTSSYTATSDSVLNYLFESNVSGTARIYVDSDASTGTIIGGSYISHAISISANDGVCVTGSSITESTVGATDITIVGGTIEGSIYAGGYIASVSATIADGLDIEVVANASILGDTQVTISDGIVGVSGSVILGGGVISSSGVGGEAIVYGNTNIDITGGTITADIYGGGTNSNNVGNADVEGNTTINISGGTITGNVTASGLNYSQTKGDATITLSGSATIYGNLVGETATSDVLGITTLNLGSSDASYKKSVQNIMSFDIVNVATESNVTVEGSLSDVEKLNIYGTLTLTESTNANTIYIADGGVLNVTATNDYILSSESLVWDNAGVLNISAAIGDTVGKSYEIFASDVSVTGNIVAFGGTISGNTFTVGESYTLYLDGSTPETVSADGIVYIAPDAESSDITIIMAFNSDNDITITSVTSISDDTATSFANLVIETVGSQDDVIASSAYEFNLASDLGAEDSVLLSFYVGEEDYDIDQFTIYHKSGDELWEVIDPSDLSYSDGYLSFVVDGFSYYGYSLTSASLDVIPEPSTATLSLLALAGLMARRRRKTA